VNNAISQQGIDQVTLSDGDAIGWNYTVYETTRHSTGRYAAIKERVAGS